MSQKLDGMVLAAGIGTRFRPHTDILPKPALPLINIPLLYHSLYIAKKFHAGKIVINTHHLPGVIQDLCYNLSTTDFNIGITLSHEEKILGNAGGLKKAESHLNTETFFVLNADTILIPQDKNFFADFIKYHENENSLASLALMPHALVGKKYGGVWVDENRSVCGFGKTSPQPDKPLTAYHFFGLRLFSQEIFKHIPYGNSDIFVDVITKLIGSNEKIKSLISEFSFFDGGDLESFLLASKETLKTLQHSPFLQEVAKTFWPHFEQRESLNVGLNYEGPKEYKNNPNILIGNNVTLHPSTKLRDHCVLGDGVGVKAGVTLENTVIHCQLTISAQQEIKNKLILTSL